MAKQSNNLNKCKEIILEDYRNLLLDDLEDPEIYDNDYNSEEDLVNEYKELIVNDLFNECQKKINKNQVQWNGREFSIND